MLSRLRLRITDRPSLRHRPPGAGQLVLVPGDYGGSEFPNNPETNKRCAELFLRLEEQFDLIIVDLSAGRSYATDMALAATAMPNLRKITSRWLVFHRWTRQHVAAAAGLVYDDGGILATGERHGHDRERLLDSLRFVRTAVIDPYAKELSPLRPAQVAFLRSCDKDLNELASARNVGRTKVLSSVPLDPLLQWREQLISDNDLWESKIANAETVEAFVRLAKALVDRARHACEAQLPEGVKPRVSTCYLIDDYFNRFGNPPEVLEVLQKAAQASGLTIDYIAREAACVEADQVRLAELVVDHLVSDPPPHTTGSRPEEKKSGWLCNGQRTPDLDAAPAMKAPAVWTPPAQNGANPHSIFVDVELWSDRRGQRTWSCSFLASVWQLVRLGLLRHSGDAVVHPYLLDDEPVPGD